MTATGATAAAPPSRLGSVAPIPFVGVAALLVALIVFTPVLLASGPSSLAVRAELEIYRASGSPSGTEFEIHGIDPTVPYRWLNLSVGSGFAWNGSCPSGPLTWTYANETNETVANVFLGSSPVLVNASAVYLGATGRTVYAGAAAVRLASLASGLPALEYAPCASSSGLGAAGTWPVSQGALLLPLIDYGAGGPP